MKWELKKFYDLTTDELYDILKARIDVFVVEQECPYPECDEKDKKSYHLFAKNGEEIVAYTRIIPAGISYDEISIGRVLVNKKYRGQGLGRVLMEKSIKFIEEELNEESIRISAQEYLIDFYNSLGFNRVSETYLEDGIPHLEMLYKKI